MFHNKVLGLCKKENKKLDGQFWLQVMLHLSLYFEFHHGAAAIGLGSNELEMK